MLDEFAAAGRAVRPGLPVCTSWEPGSRASSQKWTEALWSWPTARLQQLRGDSGTAAEFYIPSFQYAPSYPIALPEQELRDRAMTALAAGCLPNFTLTSPPRMLKRINAELAERAPYCCGSEPVPWAGVVYSERSQEMCETTYYKDGPTFTHYGILRALLEEKVPETCLSEHNLEHDDLSRHAVLILPDIGIISSTVADRLRAFVRAGGGLVAMARTSLCDDGGAELADFSMADLLGVHFHGRLDDHTSFAPWFEVLQTGAPSVNRVNAKLLRCGRHHIVDDQLLRDTRRVEVTPEYRRGLPADFTLAYPGEALRVAAAKGTKPVLWEECQQPGARNPFLTARRFGKGRVVYCAANLGFHYCGHYTFPYVRRLIANAVRWAAGSQTPTFQVDGPLQVQATLFRQDKRRVLHLLNAPAPQGYPPYTRQTWHGHFTSFGRLREDLPPVAGLRVRLPGRCRRVRLEPDGLTLRSRFRDGWTEVTVPNLNTHTLVVAE